MVFRRKRARTSRKAAFKAKRYGRSSGGNPLNVVLPAAAYGAARGYLSNLATPLTSKIPLGNYADEALFGVAGYFMAKKGKGMVKNIGMAMLTVEAASVGNQLVGQFGTPAGSKSEGFSSFS